jgi:O-antigen/teichoic acid export membrane protein
VSVAGRATAAAGPRRPRLVASAATTYGATVAAAVLSMVNVLLTARLLGPVGRGQIALVTTIGTVASTVALLGVEQATINLAGREPDRRPALASNALIIALVAGGAASVALALLTGIVPGVTGELSASLVAVALTAIPILVARTYLQSLAEADYRFAWSNGTRVLSPLLGVVVSGVLATAHLLTVGTVVITWLVGQGAGLLVLMWFIARRSAGFGRADAALARRALGFGLKSHLGRVMNLGNYRLDQWLVGALVGARELGRYSVAVALSETLFFLATALASAQRPDLVRATPASAARRAAAVFRAALAVTAPLALALLAAAPVLCTAVFGAGFAGSIDDLRILCLGAFGVIAVKLLGDALTAQRRPLLATAAAGVGLVVTVSLDIALIPGHGGAGAAIASTLAYSAAGAVAGVLFTRTLGGRASDLVPRGRDLRRVMREAVLLGGRLAGPHRARTQS